MVLARMRPLLLLAEFIVNFCDSGDDDALLSYYDIFSGLYSWGLRLHGQAKIRLLPHPFQGEGNPEAVAASSRAASTL